MVSVTTGLKKQPIQARSRERVDAILASAQRMIADVGYDALTTNAIAEAADVPISSLYQYFDSKEAIVAEICRRFSAELSEFVAGELTPDLLASDLEGFVDTLVFGLAALQARNSSFVCVFAGSQSDPKFDEFARTLRAQMQKDLSPVIAKVWPKTSEGSRDRLLSVWTGLSATFIVKTRTATPGLRDEILADLRTMLLQFTAHKTASWSETRTT